MLPHDDATTAGPAHAVLLGTVARRFYLDGLSKVELAAQLGLSRFKVARLLQEARETGIVRIEVGSHGDVDLDLSARVADRLGIADCFVVETTADSMAHSRAQIGKVAARYLTEVLTPADVLGLPWAQEVYAMVKTLTRLPRVKVVQLCGAQRPPGEEASALEVVSRAAQLAGTKGQIFYAPLIVDDDETAMALLRQPSVQHAAEEAQRVTRAFVGVGCWAPGALSTIYEECSAADRALTAEEGAVGEIAGVFFDASGTIIRPRLAGRIITVVEKQLPWIPLVCGLATGAAKAPALRAAVLGGLLDELVIDADLGRALLADGPG